MSTELTTIATTKEGILLAVTDEMIERFRGYPSMEITDIHDKAQARELDERRKELKKARTSVEAWRKQSNEDLLAAQRRNNAVAKKWTDLLTPIEKALEEKQAKLEAALEAERVAALEKLCQERQERLAAVGATMSAGTIRSIGAEAFEEFMLLATAQFHEKQKAEKLAAEKAAEEARQAAMQAEAERIEEERLQAEQEKERQRQEAERLEKERLAQEAAEKLAAEQARLQKEREEFEAQARARREADEKAAADLARQRAELAEQQRLLEERLNPPPPAPEEIPEIPEIPAAVGNDVAEVDSRVESCESLQDESEEQPHGSSEPASEPDVVPFEHPFTPQWGVYENDSVDHAPCPPDARIRVGGRQAGLWMDYSPETRMVTFAGWCDGSFEINADGDQPWALPVEEFLDKLGITG